MNEEAKAFGVQVVDLRLRRTDWPAKNSEAIFSRMISERQQEAQAALAEDRTRNEVNDKETSFWQKRAQNNKCCAVRAMRL